MDKIKSFGAICFIVLFFTSLVYARAPFQVSANFSLGFPQNEFKDIVDKIGISGTGHFAFNFPRSPFLVGVSLGYLVYGSETREEPFSATVPDVLVDVTTINSIFMCHFLFRIQPPEGKLRPYLDGLIGFNYLTTNTGVSSQNEIGYDSVLSSNILNDFALSYGAGGGLMIQVYRNKERRKKGPLAVYIDIGICYLKGGRAEYLIEGAIRLENDRVLYDSNLSRTDLLTGHIGVSFVF